MPDKAIKDVTAQPAPPADTDLIVWGAAAGAGLAYKMTFTQLKAKLDAMGGGGGPVAPTLVSATCPNGAPGTLVLVFSQSMTAVTIAGWSAKKNGSAWSISSVTGSGTTWTLTMGSSAVFGDVLLISYDSTTGATIGTSLELVSFTDSSVTNSVAGGSYDSDAQAYFDAQATAGYTMSTTEKDAWNTWVVGAKADGFYTDVVAVYPMNQAGTFAGVKLNAKNPLDTDGARRLAVVGSDPITYSAGTADKGTGTSATYFNTFITGTDFESPVVANQPMGAGLYFPDNDVESGQADSEATTGTQKMAFFSNPGNTKHYLYPTDSGAAADFGTPASQIGLVLFQHLNDGTSKYKKDAGSILTATPGVNNEITGTFTFLKSGRKVGFAIYFKELTDTKMNNMSARILTYLTAVGK